MERPVGEYVPSSEPAPPLTRRTLGGVNVRLREPIPAGDAKILYPLTHGAASEAVWTYLGYGPFPELESMTGWMESTLKSGDPLWFTVTDRENVPVGMAALMNADASMRRLELGHIWYAPSVHRAGVNTEAAYLMLEEAFNTYRSRRVEWKCDSLNMASQAAARRLGFGFEGVFRQHMIVKGRNRDTAWFAMTDSEWPRVSGIIGEWLDSPDPKPSLSKMMTGDV